MGISYVKHGIKGRRTITAIKLPSTKKKNTISYVSLNTSYMTFQLNFSNIYYLFRDYKNTKKNRNRYLIRCIDFRSPHHIIIIYDQTEVNMPPIQCPRSSYF